MKFPALPPIGFHHPMTFRSRGVAVPFTTPLLAGTRVRASRLQGVEIVIPNPSGTRGVYVLDWPGIRALCNPTVHDTVLFQRACRLTTVEPATIREAALEVAREGYAGREAASAAESATAHDRAQSLLAHFLLVKGLLERFEPDSPPTALPPGCTSRQVTAALRRIAPFLGRSVPQLASGLSAISAVLAPIGMVATADAARIPRLLTHLKGAQIDLRRWLDADGDNDIGGLGQAIATALGTACDTGTMLLERTRSALADTPSLLKRWIRDPYGVSAQATRCDWLLDGWERVRLLWVAASTEASRRAALLEMAPLVPVLPREVMQWTDTPIAPDAMTPTCRVTSHEDAWRTGGSAFALIERNERLLAMSTWTGPPPPWPEQQNHD